MATTDDEALEAEGLDALDRFITTFNSRDAAAWAAALSYPHVRVSPRHARAEIVADERAYAAAVTYDAADAMGWDHSEWDTKEVLAVSPARVHAAAQWCRYAADGRRILANNVSYVITRVDGRWGIQARFGVDSPPPTDPAAIVAAATAAFEQLWSALARGDGDAVRRHAIVPFTLVDVGAVDALDDPHAIVDRLGGLAASSTIAAATALQVGDQGVNLGVDLVASDGRRLHGLVLIARREHWSVAAASVLDAS